MSKVLAQAPPCLASLSSAPAQGHLTSSQFLSLFPLPLPACFQLHPSIHLHSQQNLPATSSVPGTVLTRRSRAVTDSKSKGFLGQRGIQSSAQGICHPVRLAPCWEKHMVLRGTDWGNGESDAHSIPKGADHGSRGPSSFLFHYSLLPHSLPPHLQAKHRGQGGIL